MADKITRCAIYTRKSTEEGLEKEFNSLEAQREACEAYIKSQRHEGWVLIPTYYDDGGYTGGNMERPGLQALMADIRAGKVDVIVVYKVDRLSRSLHDFAQMVAVFDAQKVSFVSITQQFNTTTSMGRLTLNILLSFAQFEREVIGERVRDKIAASKRKGMWMGGFPPLGYDIEERKLIANLPEAALVRTIFERYIEMRSGFKVAQWLNENGHQNKRWINRNGVVSGGHPFCGQAVYKILNNPVYIGMIRHHENIYEGQHQGILPGELWEQAQSLLKTGREKRKKRYVKHGMLLAGKCFSAAGEIYTPTYTTRGAKHYRYYEAKAEHKRVNALEVEAVVVDTIRMLAREPAHWKQCWQKYLPEMGISDAQRYWERHWENWQEFTAHEKQNAMGSIIQRIVIAEESLTIRLSYAGIAERVRFAEALTDDEIEKPDCAFRPTVTIHDEGIELEVWAKFQLQGRKQRVMDKAGRPLHNVPKSQCNPVLVNAVVKSYRWNRQLERGDKTITQLAAEARLGRTYVSRIITLIYLAPDILSAILKGTQPSTLQLQHLLDNLPVEWSAQRAKLGMA